MTHVAAAVAKPLAKSAVNLVKRLLKQPDELLLDFLARRAKQDTRAFLSTAAAVNTAIGNPAIAKSMPLNVIDPALEAKALTYLAAKGGVEAVNALTAPTVAVPRSKAGQYLIDSAKDLSNAVKSEAIVVLNGAPRLPGAIARAMQHFAKPVSDAEWQTLHAALTHLPEKRQAVAKLLKQVEDGTLTPSQQAAALSQAKKIIKDNKSLLPKSMQNSLQ